MEQNHWPYKPAVPVTAEPLPEYVRREIHAVVRSGGTVIRVDELEAGEYRILYRGDNALGSLTAYPYTEVAA